ncbi:dTMP kinase [Solidesulfovibrio sp.]|uniref:dTMP kinase n=1 Tax=Solidesulfovibrio sp. TaxID=2910990 RepID=UPI002612C842|nr:dTMP kinase [Solidesulfovibrio sp.]
MFITFEGVEGSGKSTQIKRLTKRLEKAGRTVTVTRQPGGCDLGTTLRAILLSTKTQNLDSRAELFLYLADRAQHVAEIIRPALLAGHVVLCDRFADSTVAYQGYGRGLDVALLNSLNDVAVAGTWPNHTFLLDIDPEQGLRRALARNIEAGTAVNEGRFEAEHLDFHRRVRQGYLALASAHPRRFRIVDAAKDPDAVETDIWRVLELDTEIG